jgi:hypothetical protein
MAADYKEPGETVEVNDETTKNSRDGHGKY